MRSGRASIGLLEFLEYALPVGLDQTRPGIGNGEANAVGTLRAHARYRHQHPAGVRKFYRVADKVEKYLPNPARIGNDRLRDVRCRAAGEADVLAVGAAGQQFDDTVA